MNNNQTCSHHHALCIDCVPIFSELTAYEKEAILSTSVHKKYLKGDFIFLPGDVFDNLIVVISGMVKVAKTSPTGKEQIMRILRPGDFIGELFLFSSHEVSNAAEALEETMVCIIKGSKVKHYLLGNPNIAIKFLQKYTERIIEAEALVEQIGLRNVETRIASYLLDLLKNNDDDRRPYIINLPVSKKDMASFIGTTPETLSRKLSLFQNNGWIEMNGQRNITIHDKKALEELLY